MIARALNTTDKMSTVTLNDLIMVNDFGPHRGWIFAIEGDEAKLLYRSPSVQTVVARSIEQDGNEYVLSTSDATIRFPVEGTQFHRHIEGVVLRAFEHNGTFYVASHKQLKVDNSTFRDSPKFREMYNRLGGPQSVPSGFHSFVLSHNSLRYATLDEPLPEQGQLTYIGTQDGDSLSMDVRPTLSVEEANQFLKQGFHPDVIFDEGADERSFRGEAVVAHVNTAEGMVIYEIRSPAYDFRCFVANGQHQDPLLMRFLIASDFAKKPEVVGSDFMVMPLMTVEQMGDVIRDHPHTLTNIVNDPRQKVATLDGTEKHVNAMTRDELKHLIWQNFVLSVPLHRTEEVLSWLYITEPLRMKVTNYVSETVTFETGIPDDMPQVLADFIVEANANIVQKGMHFSVKTGKDRYASFPTYSAALREACRALLRGTNGHTLYRLQAAVTSHQKKKASAIRKAEFTARDAATASVQ